MDPWIHIFIMNHIFYFEMKNNLKADHWAIDGTVPATEQGEHVFHWNSVHCGAEVVEGEKWMANLWITVGKS